MLDYFWYDVGDWFFVDVGVEYCDGVDDVVYWVVGVDVGY